MENIKIHSQSTIFACTFLSSRSKTCLPVSVFGILYTHKSRLCAVSVSHQDSNTIANGTFYFAYSGINLLIFCSGRVNSLLYIQNEEVVFLRVWTMCTNLYYIQYGTQLTIVFRRCSSLKSTEQHNIIFNLFTLPLTARKHFHGPPKNDDVDSEIT